jgi:hypothetical protein
MAPKILRGGIAMRLIAATLLASAFAVSSVAPASARGGGPANIINSEGYQRALREERKQYQQAQPQPVAPVTTPTHHHHRHHHDESR